MFVYVPIKLVLDRKDCEEKMDLAFEKQNAVAIKKNRTESENRKVIKVLSTPRYPVLYGLTKVHKEGALFNLFFRCVIGRHI